jgi:hypothetical protein
MGLEREGVDSPGGGEVRRLEGIFKINGKGGAGKGMKVGRNQWLWN